MTQSTSGHLSIVIPSYERGKVALESILALRQEGEQEFEILLVDQTQEHPVDIEESLASLHASGSIRWLRLDEPSIPAAMNVGLLSARGAAVLFLDDDIVPGPNLARAHADAQRTPGLVAGQVLQPGQVPTSGTGSDFAFTSSVPALIKEFMGGNFSVDRGMALELGGFDENFIGAAYRFEAEFASRYVERFGPIRFAPDASIRHLAIPSGGTRAHGHHLRTSRPTHAVGAYYFLLRTKPRGWLLDLLWRPFRSIRTRYHLSHPWRIPASLLAEARGLAVALRLNHAGPRLLPGVARGLEASTCA